jgi:branched-chain amino acid transport system substrate-binding protein
MRDLSFIGEESLDGTPVYHLAGDIPLEKLELDDSDVEGNMQIDVWIGVEDDLVRQMTMVGEIPVDEAGEMLPGAGELGTLDLTMTITWSDFGKDVIIEAPKIMVSELPDSELPGDFNSDEPVLALAFSLDGQTLAAAGTDGAIRLYHVPEPDSEPFIFTAHSDWIRVLAFSPDGQLLASAGDDRTVKLWDVTDPKAEPTVLSGHEDWVRTVAFSPDRHFLASAGDDRSIRIWDLNDLDTEPAILAGHLGWIKSLAICPDGSLMISGDDEGGVFLWNMTDLEEEPTVVETEIVAVTSVACSPDSQTVVWTGDFLIDFLDVADPEAGPVTSIDHDSSINFLVFSPDEQHLATGDDSGSVILWDLTNPGKEPVVFAGHDSWVNTIAFSPDGRLLASADADGRVRLWDVENPEAEGIILGSVGECSDNLGCVVVGPDEAILLASALVISGPNIDLGTDSQRGVELAIDFQEEVLGHSIELQAEDDGCNAEGGQASATKIVSDPQIVAMIGTSCSGAGVPAAHIITEAGYVMISPSNTSPALTDPDQAWQPGYLRTAHNDEVQGAAMAEFVFSELGLTKAAAIHDGDPYTEGLARQFADAFEALGGEIVAFEAESPEASNVEPLLTTIAAAGPELIYSPVFVQLGSQIFNTAKDVAGLENVILAGADGLLSPTMLENTAGTSEGMYFSGPDLSFENAFYIDEFLPAYLEKYGIEPTNVFHAHSYDATMMLFQAIEEVAQEGSDGTLLIGRQALRDALYAMANFDGITGSLTCTEFGDCANTAILIYQVLDGEFVEVWSTG